MQEVSFSIVIPVYNVEDTLERCITSAVNQSYSKLEIILINDGSTDNSGKIADEISSRYKSVKVFHKKNGGLSDARNYGLLRAKNDYIIFLDSDDYITDTTCIEFNEAITKQKQLPDIVAGGMVKNDNGIITETKRSSTAFEILAGENFLLEELKSKTFFVPVCSYVFKRVFLSKNNLLFPKGLLHEDEYFTPKAILNANTILPTDIMFYHYIIRDGSITKAQDLTKNAQSIFDISEKLTNEYDHIENKELKNLLKSHLAKICFKVIDDAGLYQKNKSKTIDFELMEKNAVFPKEKIRLLFLRNSPKLLQMLNLLYKGIT